MSSNAELTMAALSAADITSLARARRGDQTAFSRLMEPYRRELVAYCYRMAGSLSEAEDLAQEAFIRAYRALDGFEGRAAPRAWLYRIAHNLCLNHVQRRPPAWASLDDVADTQISGTAPDVETTGLEREEVRLGFVALVQSLPPRQRAALVLRDVLGWSAEEAARILETTVPAVKNALARARQTLAAHMRGVDPADISDYAMQDAQVQDMIAEWVDAFEKGNTARMVTLLTDAEFTVNPQRNGYNNNKNSQIKQGIDRHVAGVTKNTAASRLSQQQVSKRRVNQRGLEQEEKPDGE